MWVLCFCVFLFLCVCVLIQDGGVLDVILSYPPSFSFFFFFSLSQGTVSSKQTSHDGPPGLDELSLDESTEVFSLFS